MIEVKDISIGHKLSGRKSVVVGSNISFSLHKGEITSLLGANGAGKSTLIKTLCGFIPPLEGSVELDSRDISKISRSELSKMVGVVLTDRVSDGGLTLYELVSLGRYPHTNFFGRLSSNDHKKVEEAMKQVGIWQMRDRYIGQISDGERQRGMIAKTLAQECKIVILDEPTAFLDAKSRIECFALLRKIAKESGRTILLSTHDIEIALAHSDKLILIEKSGSVEVGVTEDMVLSKGIERLFEKGDSNQVHFDILSGSFKISPSSDRGTITISGDGACCYWLENFLARYGFKLSYRDCRCDYKIKILSASEIIVDDGYSQKRCFSFAELRKSLNLQ